MILLRFRTKNHSLPNVIQGRGRNRRPYNERLCPTCNVLGDEFHCLFECENTRHIRHVLPRYYTFRPNMFKFSFLLSSEEPSVLRIFFYIYVILSIRVHFLIHTQNKIVSPYCVTVHALSLATLFYASNMHLFIYVYMYPHRL